MRWSIGPFGVKDLFTLVNLLGGIFAVHFIVAGEPFSLANAQLTPTLKIRRHAIREAYQTAFEALYDGKGMAA